MEINLVGKDGKVVKAWRLADYNFGQNLNDKKPAAFMLADIMMSAKDLKAGNPIKADYASGK